MTIRDKVQKLQNQYGFRRYNPEMVDMVGLRFQIMFDTPAVNDVEEMQLLLKQAKLEDFNFIMIFDSLDPQRNFLVESIRKLNDKNWFPILITLYHDKEKETFVPVYVELEGNSLILKEITYNLEPTEAT